MLHTYVLFRLYFQRYLELYETKLLSPIWARLAKYFDNWAKKVSGIKCKKNNLIFYRRYVYGKIYICNMNST